MNGRLNERDPADLRRPFRYVLWAVLLAFSLLAVRLAYMQIVRGEEYRERSESNSVRLRKIKPYRGLILDGDRNVLVDNKSSFDLVYIPPRVMDIGPVIEKVRRLYEERGLKIANENPPSGKTRAFVPVCIERDISLAKVAVIEGHALDLPGLIVEVSPSRDYPEGEVMAHLLGYTGEISKEELEQAEGDHFGPGDIVGKDGVEKYLEPYLGGRSGMEQVEVNAAGRVVRSLGRVEPVSGYNVQLTVKRRIQRAAWEGLNGRPGAVVAMDPRDGSILALVSSPSFDPNLFRGGISAGDWVKLSRNPLAPLENRVVSGQYPPGSTYKLIVAAAALQEGILKDDTRFFCRGALEMGNRQFRCWNRGGHGWVNLHRAIVESCDVFFYQVGRLLGEERLARYARQFGLGDFTGIDLPREKKGLIPTAVWKEKRFKRPWHTGETLLTSIGQGYTLTTPLQLAVAYGALANGGTLWRPRLIRQIETADGRVIKAFPPERRGVVPIGEEHLRRLRKALWGVVNEGGGTGGAARRAQGDVAGKTGTSQVVGETPGGRKRGKRYEDHALFVGFAPFRDPEIVVAVVVEHGGHGGGAAAPVAKKVIDAYFEDKAGEGGRL